MTQTINRLYATSESASRVVATLNVNGFQNDEIYVTGPGDFDPAMNSADEIVTAITRGKVLRSDAVILANGIKGGATLVTVHAVFGAAGKALDILDSHEPIPSGLASKRHPTRTWDEAAPLSSALGMPVKLDDPTVFETFSGVPTLSTGQETTSEALGIPTLADSKTTFSGLFGLPLLISNPAPLSSLFNIPLLIRR